MNEKGKYGKKGNKFIALLLSLLMLCMCSFPTGASSFGADAGAGAGGGDSFNFFAELDKTPSDDFIKDAVKIIGDNRDDNYFAAVTMELGEKELAVDGKKERAKFPATLKNGNLQLPIGDIAAAIGADTGINKSVGSVAASLPPIASALQVERLLGVEVALDGDTVIITKPFQLKQLTLFVKGGKTLADTRGASEFATNGKGAYFLQYASESAAKSAYESFKTDPWIQYVARNGIGAACDGDTPVMPDRWAAERIGSDRFGEYLEAGGKTKEDVIVAVIDTGVDVSHEFLDGRTVPGYNFVDYNDDPYDAYWHGSCVAGIIADNSPSNVKIMPIKALTDFGMYANDFVVGISIKYAADAGAKAITMSFGQYCFDDDCLDMQAVEYAAKRGALPVAASGNWYMEATNFCPAKSPYAITVSASDIFNFIPTFSNFGDNVDLAAPGVEVMSLYPFNEYGYFTGTSAAVPHVAAAAAMLALEYPELDPMEIKAKLKELTTPYDSEWDEYYGTGILNLNLFFGGDADGIRLNTHEINVSTVSEKYMLYQLIATVTPGDLINYNVSFLTDNPYVAVCDENGYVEIKGNGTATITAVSKISGLADTCVVTVDADDSGFWLGSAADAFAGGDGTYANPYKIATAEQLALVAKNNRLYKAGGGYREGEFFELINDIDLAGKEWTSIGNVMFYGVVYGNGHVIRNLRQGDDNSAQGLLNMGLFAYLANNSVQDLGITDAYVYDYTGYFNTGILASYASDSEIYGCYTTGVTSGAALIGMVSGSDARGYYSHSYVFNCYSTASTYCLFEDIYGSVVGNCYYEGGGMFARTISQSNGYDSRLTNCFADGIGNYFAEYKIGSYIEDCYYSYTGLRGVYYDDSPGTTRLHDVNADFFRDIKNYTVDRDKYWNAGYYWDFDGIWNISPGINGGLPYLRRFAPSGDKVATPVIELENVLDGVQVNIYTATPGAKIYFTYDGTVPDRTSFSNEFLPILFVSADYFYQIRAIAVRDGMEDSDIAEYNLQLAKTEPPVANPAPGLVEAGALVYLTSPAPDAVIYYTTDGSYPYLDGILYAGPILIAERTIIRAVAFHPGMAPSDDATFIYNIEETERVEKPVITMYEDLYYKYVTFDCPDENATIHYTFDENETPSRSSPVADRDAQYPFHYAGEITVKAIAVRDGYDDSDIAILKFVSEQVESPLAFPEPGIVEYGTLVELYSPTPLSVIRYTLDGSEPTIYSDIYEQPIPITETTIIRAHAFRYGFVPSQPVQYVYEVSQAGEEQVGAPGFIATDVMYGKTVTLWTETEGADIYYTLDGSDPTRADTLYEGSPILLYDAGNYIIKAFAVKDGMEDSQITGAMIEVRMLGEPEASLPSGEVVGGTKLELTSAIPGTTIYYSTDALLPYDKWTKYTQPIIINSNVNIYARAYKAGYVPSFTVGFNYTVKPAGQAAPPWFTITNVIDGKDISLRTLTADADIYYTLNGGMPFKTTDTYLYGDVPIEMREANYFRVNAVAVKDGMKDSQIASLIVVIEQVAKVKADQPSGVVQEGAEVALASPTADSIIFYTTDGSEPDVNSERYDSPITIDEDTVIKARAYKYGMAASATQSFIFEVEGAAGAGAEPVEEAAGPAETAVTEEAAANNESEAPAPIDASGAGEQPEAAVEPGDQAAPADGAAPAAEDIAPPEPAAIKPASPYNTRSMAPIGGVCVMEK